MTRAKEEFCEDIQLASHDDKERLACHKTYFRELISISTEITAALQLRSPSIPQRSVIWQRGRIQDTRRIDGYGILADGEGVKAPESVASTHASAAVKNMWRRPFQTTAVEEKGTSPAVEATPRAPAAAEREDADSVVAEQEDVGSATTGESIHLTTPRSTKAKDGDNAYYSIESSNTLTDVQQHDDLYV